MASLTSQNVSLNNLNDKLNNNIKNKLYNISTQKMEYSTCSTCADSLDLEADNFDNLGLVFYKNMDYKQKNKSYNFNVYVVQDLDKFKSNALFNGWLLTSDYKYSCYCWDILPCCWLDLESVLTKNI